MYFDGYLVVEQFQIWRLLIPYFPAGVMPMSILNILINFLWLLSIFPPMVLIFIIKGKKTVNFIHDHLNIFAKPSYKSSINSHQHNYILFIFARSITVQNYELWIVSDVYDIRMGTSSTKSWSAHDFLLYAMSHTNEMDSCYHFSILFVLGTWHIFAFIYCFRYRIFTVHAF